jgi:predicted metal-dependent phosphoesterase TrpH
VIDLHLHTTASDGLLAPAALVGRAVDAGITVMSVTDHDTVGGLDEAAAAASRLDVRLVAGIEITAVEGQTDVHLLGYFFDPRSPALSAFLAAQRVDRVRRLHSILDRLDALGLTVDVSRLLTLAADDRGRTIGRPQVADALVAAGHARDRNDAFDRWLGQGRPGYVSRRGAIPEEVIDLIGRAGGITSLAHPGLLKMDDLIPRLASAGLAAIEARHSEHDAETERHYREIASRCGLAVSGGSDFHGDLVHGPRTLGTITLPSDDYAGLESRVR